jgi:hypothetical protein
MDDFNTPGSSRVGITTEVTNFIVQTQLENVTKILDGKLSHYIVSDKTTTHKKYVIEYEHNHKN